MEAQSVASAFSTMSCTSVVWYGIGSDFRRTRTPANVSRLGLELQKVRYLRSLSFVQGTAVNALRTSILFLMLYLIFARQISVGQFFALWIYSFFIFGPLQELGTVIGVYRETEASLANFLELLDAPREPRPENAVRVGALTRLAFEKISFTHLTATALDRPSAEGAA